MSEKVLGFVNFDGSSGENNLVEIKIPNDRIGSLRRGQYVMVESSSTGFKRLYLGQIIKGPFFQPDAFGRDSAFAMASILQADKVKFRPEYHGVCYVQILGEIENPEIYALKNPEIRPLPQAAVKEIDGKSVEKLLQLDGSLYMGELAGYKGVKVYFKNNKDIIPRNIGIFGTVGSGKTNTSQVLIEEASKSGWAVIVLDVEGEYVQMDRPTSEAGNKPDYRAKMKYFDIDPEGIKNFKVYHCTGMEGSRKDSAEFGVRFEDLDPLVLIEILELSTPQQERFLELHAQIKARKTKKYVKAKGVTADLGEKDQEQMGVTLNEFVRILEEQAGNPEIKGGQKSSVIVLLRKMRKLQRMGVIDSGDTLDVIQLVKNGRVSVIDLNNSYSHWVNNIIISDVLRRIFERKKNASDSDLPPTLIVIEEAHSFISRGRQKYMEATLDILREITRRGRKRWLGLCFISQQPSHLPPEIYELCNTKIIHKITGGRNLDAVKASAGDVDQNKLAEIPMLVKGSALVISPQFRYPLMVDLRPCKSDRKYVD